MNETIYRLAAALPAAAAPAPAGVAPAAPAAPAPALLPAEPCAFSSGVCHKEVNDSVSLPPV